MKISKAKLQQIIKEEIARAVSEGEGMETKVLDRYGNPAKKLRTWEFSLKDGSHPMSITHEGWALARADYKRELRKKGVSAPDEKIKSTKRNQ